MPPPDALMFEGRARQKKNPPFRRKAGEGSFEGGGTSRPAPQVGDVHSAAMAVGLSPWNCSVSVEPAMAVVEDLPAEIAVATASK